MDILNLLNDKARFYTKELWETNLTIPIKINTRLRTTHGRYCFSHIDLSKNILNEGYLVDDTLLHELCHWYCHISGKQYDDYSKDFEDELKRIGASSTETTIIENGKILYNYRTGCYSCGICNSEFETNDFLENKVEGKIGTPIKKYTCCNENMEFLGVRFIPGVYVPNEKVLNLITKYKNHKRPN